MTEIQVWVRINRTESLTCVNIAFALDTFMRVPISFATKLSAIDTTTRPERMMAKYITTALYVIGISIAIASPLLNNVSSAFATVLGIQYS